MVLNRTLSLNGELQRQVRFFSISIIVAVPVALASSAIHLSREQVFDAALDLALVSVITLAYFNLRKILTSIVLSRIAIGILFLYLIYHAAVDRAEGSGVLWSYVFPFLAFFLLGSREGRYWSLAYLAGLMILVIFPDVLGSHEFGPGFRMRLMGSLLLVNIFAYAFEHFREMYFEQLRESIEVRQRGEMELRALLGEKELLLREIHHRVKNNLSVLQSFLSLECNRPGRGETRDALMDIHNRITAMGLIHESLYRHDQSSLINVREYLSGLSGRLERLSSEQAGRIEIVIDAEDMRLDVDIMVPLGLIVNELMTNAFKYAFAGRDSGRISITLRREGGHVRVTVSDDGVGLPEDIDVQAFESFGFRIINALVDQIGGRLSCRVAGGTRFDIEFPEAQA